MRCRQKGEEMGTFSQSSFAETERDKPMKLAIYGTGNSSLEMLGLIIYCKELKKQWEELVFIDDTKAPGEFQDCRMLSFDDFAAAFGTDEAESTRVFK